MHVVHVVSYYPPNLGGMERVVQAIAEQQAALGMDVEVLTSTIGARDQIVQDAVKVRRLPSVEIARQVLIKGLFGKLMTLPKNSIIHLHTAPAFTPEVTWLAAALRRLPYVVHFHLDVKGPGLSGLLFEAYKRTLFKMVLRRAAKVVALTAGQRTFLIDRYKLRPERVTVVPNGVTKEFFKAPRAAHSPMRILYAGRLAYQKRLERLVEALAYTRHPMHLTVVGDGYERQKLEDLTQKLKLTDKVAFKGVRRGAGMVAAYHNADVFALPSDIEGMPLCLIEASAAGLTLVGSNVPGIRDYIGVNGILVDNPSPQTFAAALDALAADPQRLAALSFAAFTLAHNYSWETLVNQLQQIYQEVSV